MITTADQAAIQARIVANVEHSKKAETVAVMFGDEHLDTVFAAHYCDEVARIYRAWAERHDKALDAHGGDAA